MTLPRCIELQWQQEIIELWLSTSRIPDDSRPGLIEMLSVVKKEVENLRFHDEHSPFETVASPQSNPPESLDFETR
jgi:hypothetical protein